MQIRWSDRPAADLDAILSYFQETNPSAVRHTHDALLSQIGSLSTLPGLGRPGRVAGSRQLVIARLPYVVAYTVEPGEDTVVILRILHGARRWPDTL